MFLQLKSFTSINQFIKSHTSYEIVQMVSRVFGQNPNEYAFFPMGGYRRLMNNDGTFFQGSGGYFFVLEDIKENLNEYKKFYSSLCDDISRQVFLKQLQFRIVPHHSLIPSAYALSEKYPQYFDEDIFTFSKGEVFADCGGYIGDTAEAFISHVGEYKRIYIYEPNPKIFEKCEGAFLLDEDVVPRMVGVGSKAAKVPYRDTYNTGSGSFAISNGAGNNDDNDFLEIVTLDEDIQEPVTFRKMDVECFELEALRGAANHIKNYTPKLAICLYHMVSDFWEIPKLIHSINPNYNYYLRHYHPQHNWEYVLYCTAK
jgi:FkbM family methyltransferase